MKQLFLFFVLFIGFQSTFAQTNISGRWIGNSLRPGYTDELEITHQKNNWYGTIIVESTNSDLPFFLNVHGEQLSDSTFSFRTEHGALNYLKLEIDEKGLHLRVYDEHWELVPENGKYITRYHLKQENE